ncbi:hypothetical protein NM688_g6777 [Phlebia brevispora]|uniref:Uncharacterized protein n=1 Tax=Phlebia brevispora TaxID=194682 RepID=A0ACC1SCL6_9APHY|nr:hypothetical protein NM688_g6777 [Phlebia brevispora]
MPVVIPSPKWSLAALVGEAITYGMNTVLFGFSVFFLITRRERSTGTAILGLMTVLMFSMSTLHFSLTAYYSFASLSASMVALEPTDMTWPGSCPIYVPVLLQIINVSIVKVASVRMFLSMDRHRGRFKNAHSLGCTRGRGYDAQSPRSGKSRHAMVGPVYRFRHLDKTLWAVMLILFRYMMYRRDVISVLGKQNARSTGILVLLIESGALYCCTLIIYAGVSISGNAAEPVILQIMAQFTAIYPTLIIVLVCLKLTQRDAMDNLQFAMHPLLLSRGSESRSCSNTTEQYLATISQVDRPIVSQL